MGVNIKINLLGAVIGLLSYAGQLAVGMLSPLSPTIGVSPSFCCTILSSIGSYKYSSILSYIPSLFLLKYHVQTFNRVLNSSYCVVEVLVIATKPYPGLGATLSSLALL